MTPEYVMAFVVVDPLEASNTKQMSTKFTAGGVRMLLGAAINSQTPRGSLGIVETGRTVNECHE